MKILNRLKAGYNYEGIKTRYKDLEEWEKWFIKENVKLHRRYKRKKKYEESGHFHEFSVDQNKLDYLSSGIQ